MSSKPNPPHIDPTGLKISLLSVAPGAELPIANKLDQAVRKQTGAPPICFLKLFGRYDLCAIYKADDYVGGPSSSGSIDGIRGGNEILAFPWHHGGASQAFSIGNSGGHVWGLLFFRINESLARQFGATIEVVLAGSNHGIDDTGTTINVLGTTGWAELVFVVRGNTFAQVTDTLTGISQRRVIVEADGRRRKDVFSAKTFSLLGIDVDTLKGGRRALEHMFDEPFSVRQGVHPTLTVTCVPGSMDQVAGHGGKMFGEGFSVFGSTDFVFIPSKCATWGEFVGRVLAMRKDLTDHIYATSIQVASDPRVVAAGDPLQPQRVHRKGIRVTPGRMATFHRWGPVFENRLKNLSFGISNLLQDPLIGDCFLDLRRTVDSRLPALLKTTSPSNEQDRKFVGEYIEVLAYGAAERANGAFLALEHVERRFSPTKGGIQRVLKAAGGVARALLKRAGLEWNGFAVSGFQSLGFSSHGEVINLPLDTLFHPQKWWGLFHEVGHVAFWDDGLADIDGDELTEIIVKYSHPDKLSPSFIRVKNHIWEIGADTFDLYFSYGDDLDLYLRNIFNYLAPNGVLASWNHIERYFCVYEYWKHCLVGNRRRPPLRIDFDAELKAFKRVASRTGTKLDSRCIRGDDLPAAYKSASEALAVYHRAYRRKFEPKILADRMSSQNIQRAVKTILRGEVWRDEVPDPDTFILALGAKPDLSFASRIAAILTLWHTAVMQEAREADDRTQPRRRRSQK